LVVVPLQDYLGLGSDGRMNVPGTTMNNWRWRLQPGDLSQKIIRQIQTLVTESGRNCRQQ